MQKYFKTAARYSILLTIAFLITIGALPLSAQDVEEQPADTLSLYVPAPPSMVVARDFKYDTGDRVEVEWELSADDDGTGKIVGYEIFRKKVGTDELISVGLVPRGTNTFIDKDTEEDTAYIYGCSGGHERSDGISGIRYHHPRYRNH